MGIRSLLRWQKWTGSSSVTILKLSFGDIQAFCRWMNVISVDITCWSQPQKSSRNLTMWGESALTWSSKAAGRLSAGISTLDFENLVISLPVIAGWQSIRTPVPKKLTWLSLLSCWLHPRHLSLLDVWRWDSAHNCQVRKLCRRFIAALSEDQGSAKCSLE